MGYYGKFEEKLKAQELRRQGLSYREIQAHINVPKSTLSGWCKDIKLTKKQENRLLKNKMLGQRKGSLVAADNKRQKRIKRTKEIFRKSKIELGELKKRDRFLAGIAFYSAEGNKADGKTGFTNSDPLVIKFMMGWFKEFCHIPMSKFRGAIWIHDNLDESKAKTFWSNLTRIPITQFHKTYIAQNKTDSRKIRKNIHQYGVFAIRFSDSDKQRQIMGWISALLGGRITPVR